MVLAVNSESFAKEVLQAEGLVVLDMYADWCGPYRMMAPIVDALSEDHEDVKFCKLNVDDCPDIAAQYRVMSIPTVLFFKNGELARTLVGGRDSDSFEAEIEALK